MATPGEDNHPSDEGAPQPVAELQQLEPRVARRRLSQARHRATLTGLFNNLRKTVYSQSDPTASKVWGALRVWGTFLQRGLLSEARAGLELPALLPRSKLAKTRFSTSRRAA